MNRRKFFKWLGVGIAGAAVAPSALLAMEPVCVTRELAQYTPFMPHLVEGYADYSNFSSFALTEAIDKAVAQAAAELGAAAGRDISALNNRIAEGLV